MTQDEIIEMARKSGALDFYEINPGIDGDEAALLAFAKLVAQHEREACAKECEHTALRMGSEWMAQHCAQAIRARGDNK